LQPQTEVIEQWRNQLRTNSTYLLAKHHS